MLAGSRLTASAQTQVLVLHHKDNTTTDVELYTKPAITFEGDKMLINSSVLHMELKVGDTARHALEQIDSRGYAKPYLTDGRKIVKVGIRFDTDKHSVDEWEVASLKP